MHGFDDVDLEALRRPFAALADTPGRRNVRAGQQEAPLIITLLQELTMRSYEFRGALFEGYDVLSLQEKMLQ